jgi:membrane associated rhomboid family serine protease
LLARSPSSAGAAVGAVVFFLLSPLLSPLLAGDDDAVGVSVAAVLAALGGGVPAAALGFDIASLRTQR